MIGAYAAKNRDDAVRLSSSSGGLFPALCKWAISEGGVVYGACFDTMMQVVHDRAHAAEGCKRFSGAKYVQSDVGTSYSRVRADLRAGRLVLFSGTPCQVAGLRSYLAAVETAGRLVTIDLVCHGVTSPRVWRDHVELVRSRVRGDLVDYRFRDKSGGWHESRHRAYTSESTYSDYLVNAYRDIFNGNYALRPSCNVCPFANLDRVGDLTIGDYWGIESHFPEMDDDRGVSIALVNTEVGRDLLNVVGDQLTYWPVTITQCMQPNLRRPTPSSGRRDGFWRLYQKLGYGAVVRLYTDYGFLRRNLRRARRALRGNL